MHSRGDTAQVHITVVVTKPEAGLAQAVRKWLSEGLLYHSSSSSSL